MKEASCWTAKQMPSFAYIARDQQGSVQTGSLDAVSEDEVIGILQRRGLLVTTISYKEPGKKSSGAVVKQAYKRRMHSRITVDDQVLLCQQLATLVEAGVPLLRSLQVVSAQVESRLLLLALDEVRRDVEAGRTFRESLSKHPRAFSTLWLNLVETGEASGHLAQALRQLAGHFESAQHLQNAVQTAMTYPAFLMVAAVAVMAVFMYWVIPRFRTMFAAMNMTLPPLTLFVMGLSQAAQQYSVAIFLGGAALGYSLVRVLKTDAGQWMRDRLVLQLPLAKTLFTFVQLAEFGRGLSTLLESGVPLLSGLGILENSATNRVYAQAIGRIKEAVKEGKSMAEPMGETGLFPPMTVQMVLVGEEVGELAKMVNRVARYYEERVEIMIARMTRLFEPIAIVVMGGLVLIIVLSVFLPIFNLANGPNV